jgi:hypothetical protein
MNEQTKDGVWFLRSVTNPKLILLCLSLFCFLYVPYSLGGVSCFHNWSDLWYMAFSVLVAASALCIGKWWSYAGAIVSSSSIIYNFLEGLLKVYRLLPLTSEELEMVGTPAEYWSFWRNNPEGLVFIILPGVIFCYAIICLVKTMSGKRRISP